MRIGRILCPVRELGPGNRLGIWVQGCMRRCPGCANPELWSIDERKDIPVGLLTPMVITSIVSQKLTGVTSTGGEPMLQAKELAVLLKHLKPLCEDILLFTGFTYEQLLRSEDPDVKEVLSSVSVLVDGEYIKEQNAGDRLRGSTNQRIIFLDKEKRNKYETYIGSNERLIDSFITTDGIVSVGIHPQEFLNQAWSIISPAGEIPEQDEVGGAGNYEKIHQ